MIKFSKNKKTNKLYNAIYLDLKKLGENEILRYINEFPREKDYNIAQYGNLLCYYSDIYDLFRSCGYKSMDSMREDKIWELYLYTVGYIARWCFKYKHYTEEVI